MKSTNNRIDSIRYNPYIGLHQTEENLNKNFIQVLFIPHCLLKIAQILLKVFGSKRGIQIIRRKSKK